MQTKTTLHALQFGSDPLSRLLARMAMPAIIAMVVNGLYYLADTAFVGWGVGTEALAGLAVVFPVQMFMIAWGSMLGMGTAALIARKSGEGRQVAADSAAWHGVLLAVISGVVFLAITLMWLTTLLKSFGATAVSFGDAKKYLTALQYGFVFVFLSMVGFNILRAKGAAAQAGIGMLLGTLINVILDPLFIFVFEMGVAGAAWATVLARALSTLYFFQLLRKQNSCRPHPFEGRLAGTILALGVGNFLGQVSVSIVAVVMNTSLRKYGTVIDLAVYGVMSRILVFITMPLLGLAQGLQPIAAFNYGGGAFERVRTVSLYALGASTVIGFLMYILPLLAPGFTLHLFTNDQELIVSGTLPIRVSLCALPVLGTQIIGFTLFQALGRPVHTLLLSLSRQLIFLVPLLYILPNFMGVFGLWAAFPLADTASALLSLGMIRMVFVKEMDLRSRPTGRSKQSRALQG